MATARMRIPYSRKELHARGPQRIFSGDALREVAFPLGGIGAGCITLGGWGELRDWEIKNRPAKGYCPGDSFFVLKAEAKGRAPVLKVLQGPAQGDAASSGHSAARSRGEGLPCFRDCRFTGEFPFARVTLSDPEMPLEAELVAWSPFIPLNDRDSSIPCVVLTYTLRNRLGVPVRATVYGSVTNDIGDAGGRRNSKLRAGGLTGLLLANARSARKDPAFGTVVLATTSPRAGVFERWPERRGWEKLCSFWEMISAPTLLPPRPARGKEPADTGTVSASVTVRPGKSASVTFIIAWHFPNCQHWRAHAASPSDSRKKHPTWLNWYATEWRDAPDVARYVAKDLTRLEGETRRFHDALFSSTLPAHVLDAVSSQMSILRTTTCLRLTDGTFYGFEGASNACGCCEGSCTHVWNYAQALPYLFPALQRSMNEAHYRWCETPDGRCTFRMPLPLGAKDSPAVSGAHPYHPCADGQMGVVLQVYREWLLSGDDGWLRRIWPNARKALEFAWKYWDADRDGVMEGMQHNTYDIEFYGPNTMMGSLYLAALLAAERMALRLGDAARAREYRRLFESGSRKTDRELWNGEYYEQRVNPDAHKAWPARDRRLAEKHGRDSKYPWPKWQYGRGCLSDQMIGQWYADMLGLGRLYRPERVRKTLRAIFGYNWRREFFGHPNFMRLYAQGPEAGLLICTWPRGGRPGNAFYFGDEVFCGIEYQVASNMIYEGLVDEGLAIVKGVRDRHDGRRRNPWDEFECGHHYSRSMASYAVMLALEGFSYSAAEARMGFAPKVRGDFRGFWCVGSGYGVYSDERAGGRRRLSIETASGALELRELSFAGKAGRARARLGRRAVRASIRKGAVFLDAPVTVTPGRALVIELA